MYYVYVIKSLSKKKLYIGYTADLKRRVREHNDAKNIATKYHVPWQLLYYEAYSSEQLARERENLLKKRGKTWQNLRKRLLSQYDT